MQTISRPFLQNDVDYTARIKAELNNCLQSSEAGDLSKISGKVRDIYDLGDRLLLITTDRQSAFDRVLAEIPFKGQVLNQSSAWWFEQTKHIVPNHVMAVPDPNAIVGKKCTVFPIEFVVRGHITASTSTSLWTQYNNGVRTYCGNSLPDGLKKNQKLEHTIITPTTKEADRDRPIAPEEIVADNWMSREDWDACSQIALKLFALGQEIAAKNDLILVDTKYEMGRDEDGNILLIDEIHTPDSSRFWIQSSFDVRQAQGQEPENIDKEFLRLWFKNNCNPYHDSELPEAPEELVIELSRRYILLYEMITGQPFDFPVPGQKIHNRMYHNLSEYL